MSDLQTQCLHWLTHGSVGTSSKSMCLAVLEMAPCPNWGINHPHDPDDLNRCIKFLNQVPEARNHMDKIAALNETWAKLIANWDKLEESFLDEVGYDWCNGDRAPKTYELLKSLRC